MQGIILSINPEFVKNILNKTKKYEYRTKVAKRDIKAILIYCTFPTKKVVAQVKIKSILADTPENLWHKTKDFSGTRKEFYDKYFENRKVAYAYELGEILEYKTPKPLEYFGVRFAPQSYVYVEI